MPKMVHLSLPRPLTPHKVEVPHPSLTRLPHLQLSSSGEYHGDHTEIGTGEWKKKVSNFDDEDL